MDTRLDPTRKPQLPPAAPLASAAVFAATSLLFFICLYSLLPFLRQIGVGWLACFNLVLAAPMCSFRPRLMGGQA